MMMKKEEEGARAAAADAKTVGINPRRIVHTCGAGLVVRAEGLSVRRM